MAYKDKDKQREANKVRQQRRRDVIKSKGVTDSVCDGQGVTSSIDGSMPSSYYEKVKIEGKRGITPQGGG